MIEHGNGQRLAKAPSTAEQATPREAALEKLREWDPVWAEHCVKMATNPSTDGILSV